MQRRIRILGLHRRAARCLCSFALSYIVSLTLRHYRIQAWLTAATSSLGTPTAWNAITVSPSQLLSVAQQPALAHQHLRLPLRLILRSARPRLADTRGIASVVSRGVQLLHTSRNASTARSLPSMETTAIAGNTVATTVRTRRRTLCVRRSKNGRQRFS